MFSAGVGGDLLLQWSSSPHRAEKFGVMPGKGEISLEEIPSSLAEKLFSVVARIEGFGREFLPKHPFFTLGKIDFCGAEN